MCNDWSIIFCVSFDSLGSHNQTMVVDEVFLERAVAPRPTRWDFFLRWYGNFGESIMEANILTRAWNLFVSFSSLTIVRERKWRIWRWDFLHLFYKENERKKIDPGLLFLDWGRGKWSYPSPVLQTWCDRGGLVE